MQISELIERARGDADARNREIASEFLAKFRSDQRDLKAEILKAIEPKAGGVLRRGPFAPPVNRPATVVTGTTQDGRNVRITIEEI